MLLDLFHILLFNRGFGHFRQVIEKLVVFLWILEAHLGSLRHEVFDVADLHEWKGRLDILLVKESQHVLNHDLIANLTPSDILLAILAFFLGVSLMVLLLHYLNFLVLVCLLELFPVHL